METVLWAGHASMIAIGRWNLIVSRVDVPPTVLVIALSVLVPAAIVNVIVLLLRPVVGERASRPQLSLLSRGS